MGKKLNKTEWKVKALKKTQDDGQSPLKGIRYENETVRISTNGKCLFYAENMPSMAHFNGKTVLDSGEINEYNFPNWKQVLFAPKEGVESVCFPKGISKLSEVFIKFEDKVFLVNGKFLEILEERAVNCAWEGKNEREPIHFSDSELDWIYLVMPMQIYSEKEKQQGIYFDTKAHIKTLQAN